MGYFVEYIISSGIILEYDINKRDPKLISFKRYGIKFKTGYPTGQYIRGTISRNSIFVEYLIVLVTNKIIDSLERGQQSPFQSLFQSLQSAELLVIKLLASEITTASGITSYRITSQRNYCSQRNYQSWNHQPAKSLASGITTASGITIASGITSHGITGQRNHCSQRNHQLWNHWPAKLLQPAKSLQLAELLVMESLASEITSHYSSYYSSHYSQRNYQLQDYITILLQFSLLKDIRYPRDILFHAKILRIYYPVGRYQ